MKQNPRRPHSIAWMCIGLLIAALAGRVVWIASHTETGFETLRAQSVDAVRALAIRPRVPVSQQEPIDQAEFWLDEVDRVVAVAPENAELAMGAALILDCPSPEYFGRYIRGIQTFPGGGQVPDLDGESIKKAGDAFENECKTRCLDLAATATKLSPTNVDWWRLRALLLWRQAFYSYDATPRDSDWQLILDECAAHDPDNALYDYLAAYFLWEASVDIDYSGSKDRLMVQDKATFDRSRDCFRRGQAKSMFAQGYRIIELTAVG